MKIKNTGKKVIGFGAVILPPDAIDTLPEGYGPDHPVVKFYLSKGWIKELKGDAKPKDDDADAKAATEKAAAEAKAKADAEAAAAAFNALTPEQQAAKDAEDAAAAKKAELVAKIKAVGKMNRDALRDEATALGIEWVEGDTKEVLVQKITEKLTAEMG